jgi:cyclomaltodextrinase / maltogenic alpha-amylase / neopullulanase
VQNRSFHIPTRLVFPLLRVPALLLVIIVAQIMVPCMLAHAQGKNVPEWARGIIWYRIFPDRFYNGDSANDAMQSQVFPDKRFPWEISRWTSNWYQLTTKELMFDRSFYPNALLRQYGGDLEGVRMKLDYLQQLGVNAIIMSPLFEANSAHKYDIVSLHHIDRHFGPNVPLDTVFMNREAPEDPKTWYLTAADRTFFELIRELHRRGMKIVLDVQFAHAGVNFWAFKDLLQKQETSRFGGWFTVEDWDHPETPFASEFKYKSMWNIPAFPEFHKDSLGLAPGLKDYVFASIKRWMDPDGDGNPSDGIDGWRVELAGELNRRFWNDFMSFVKKVNPGVLVIGGKVDEQPWKSPFDLEDNESFPREVSLFFLNRRITPTQIDDALGTGRAELEFSEVDAHVNRIGDHETERMASMCVNATTPYDEGGSPQKNGNYRVRPPNDAERVLQRWLLLYQFTIPGSPLIYYGDEAGMWGGDDPDCRKPMVWPDMDFDRENAFLINGDTTAYTVAFDSSVYSFYQFLIEMRQKHIALRQGSYKTLLLDDVRMLYAYERHSGADRVYVIFNTGEASAECRLMLSDVVPGVRLFAPIEQISFIYEKEGLDIVVPPGTGTILIPRL